VALANAIRELREASTPDAIADAVLRYFGSFCGRMAYFTIRGGVLRCEKVLGNPAPSGGEALALSLEEPSVVRDAIATRFPYRGPLGASGVAAKLRSVFVPEGADEVILLPMAVRHRVVSLAYGDHITEEPSEAGMTRVSLETGLAYERLIAARKGQTAT